jgi:hypothetical protein
MNWQIKIIIIVCLFLFVMTSVIPAQATQVYKGNGTDGGLVPDFSQKYIANNSGICAAAAVANSFWYFDQHGYVNLVDQTNESSPNNNWINDSKNLTLGIAKQIYGESYVNNKSSRKSNGSGVAKSIAQYLKERNHSVLKVKYFNGSDASYAKWESELNRSEDVIAKVSWRYANGTKVVNGTHAMTGVGYDTDGGKFKIAHGWGENHSDSAKPYNKSFFNEYNITNTSSNQMKIPKSNNTGADVFQGTKSKADHLLVEGFWAISPISNKTNRVEDKRLSTENPKIDEYRYTVLNLGDEAIYLFALEIQVPFYNIRAPPGWSWQPWDPTLTSDITPGPLFLQPPGEQPVDVSWEPSWNGVIWYTETNPILPVCELSGFSYEVDSYWEHGETTSFSGLSNGISEYSGGTSTGLTTEFDLISGPVKRKKPVVPTAHPIITVALLGIALVLFLRRELK